MAKIKYCAIMNPRCKVIKAIAFDFDDTLYEGIIWNGWETYCKESIMTMLGNISPKEMQGILKKYNKKNELNSHDVVEILNGEGIDLEAWNIQQRDFPFERDFSKARAIGNKKLREFARHFSIYCVTNNVPSDFARTADKLGIDVGVFKKIFFNDCLKGDCSKFTRYKEILKLENIKPHELLVIGNDYTVDIVPAKQLGAHTLHIYGPNFDIENIKNIK